MGAFFQILQGLDALHSEGFIHRDVKPSNVGVVSQSADNIEIVILDYGETFRIKNCWTSPGKIGTIPFLAPEMESTMYGNKVDI
jgi:serine/threonine protein kinase